GERQADRSGGPAALPGNEAGGRARGRRGHGRPSWAAKRAPCPQAGRADRLRNQHRPRQPRAADAVRQGGVRKVIRVLDGPTIEALAPHEEVIPWMREAMRLVSAGETAMPLRQVHAYGDE